MWQSIRYMLLEYPLFSALHTFITYHTLATIVALVTLAVIIEALVLIFRYRHSEKLRSFATFIDSIPFIIGLVPLTGLSVQVMSFILAFRSISSSGTGDPRVVSGGIAALLVGLTVLSGLFFLFLGSWLAIRMLYGRYIAELDT